MSLNRQLYDPLLPCYINGLSTYRMVLHYNTPDASCRGKQPRYLHTLLRCLDTPKCVTHLVYFIWYIVLILPKQRRLLSIHTTVELFHLKFTSRQYCTWKPKTCWFTFWSQAKQNKTYFSTFFHFFFSFNNNILSK